MVSSDSLKTDHDPQRDVLSRGGEFPLGRGPPLSIADEAVRTYSTDESKWRPYLSHSLRRSDHVHLPLSGQTAENGFAVRAAIEDPTQGLLSRQLHLASREEHMSHMLLPAYVTLPSSESIDHALLSRMRENGRSCIVDYPRALRSTRLQPYYVGHTHVLAQVPYDLRGPMLIPQEELYADAVGRMGFRTASTTTDLMRRKQYLDESPLLSEPSSDLINAYLYDPSIMYEARARALTRRLATEDLIHKRAMSLAGIPPDSSRPTTGLLDSIINDNRRPMTASQSSLEPVSQSVGKNGSITGLGPRSVARPKAELAELLPYPAGKSTPCHFSQRVCVPLSTDEDENWLSEFLCFVRADLVEIFRATEDDVRSRNSSKKVVQGQVGIRCRYCAHLPPRRRASRSSSYPFTLSRIYQSLTMMLRDHFGSCNAIPSPIRERFLTLKGKTAQGATGSNNFWEHSAKRLGLIDSESGIWVNENADLINSKEGSGHRDTNHERKVTTVDVPKTSSSTPSLHSSEVLLVIPEDRVLISDFMYTLMSHVQLIKLDESERIGNRKNLPVGMAGIGCRYCCEKNRKGFCRIFPARRRTLPIKINDLYEHVRRCPLCPKESREKLKLLKNMKSSHEKETKTMLGEKDYFDRLWGRMCHGSGISMDSK